MSSNRKSAETELAVLKEKAANFNETLRTHSQRIDNLRLEIKQDITYLDNQLKESLDKVKNELIKKIDDQHGDLMRAFEKNGRTAWWILTFILSSLMAFALNVASHYLPDTKAKVEQADKAQVTTENPAIS